MSAAAELRRLACFAALALFVALGWVQMLAEPPLARTALACLPVIAAAALLILLRAAGLGDRAATAVGMLLLPAATAGALVAIGLPAHLLVPGSWSELRDGVETGFAGIGEGVSYPYDGPNQWSRLIMLLGAPLLVGLSALLTFLPAGRDPRAPRLAGLAVLVAGYGMAATIHGPEAAVAAGLALMAGILAWIWLPGLERRGALSALALLALAAVVALPLTARLDRAEALVDYKSWKWSAGPGTSFSWEHSYGPIDWERTGETVMTVESAEPNYWKASVLDRFDGRAWVRSGVVGPSLELPVDVEPEAVIGEMRSEWLAEAKVTIGELRSELVPGPGTDRAVVGGITWAPSSDHAILSTPEPLSQGDAYEVRGYAPDPGAAQMRAAGWETPPRLAPMTELLLPDEAGGPPRRIETRGLREGRAEQARLIRDRSAYSRTAALSDRLTADAASAYDAVKAIEGHLLGGYEYDENPPEAPLPLQSFLFDERIGYCQQFSGAMALLLRMQGIPSRIASGFSPGEPASGNRYRVRDLDAHSWVEVYFAGIGWVPFDPTPAASPAQLRNGGAAAASSAASSLDPLLTGAEGFAAPGPEQAAPPPEPPPDRLADAAAAPRPSSSEGSSWLGAVPLALLAGAGLLLAPGLWRRFRERRLDPRQLIDARVAELDRALGRLRQGHTPGVTLLELEGALRSRAEPLACRYLERLRRGRFQPSAGPLPRSAGRERRALRRRLSSGRGLRGRLTAWREIPPLSPRR